MLKYLNIGKSKISTQAPGEETLIASGYTEDKKANKQKGIEIFLLY